MKQTVEIIGYLVAGLTKVEPILSIQINSGVATIYTKNTYWLNKGSKVVINGTTYEVLSVVYNELFTINAPSLSATEYTLNAPDYIHGTRNAVSGERDGMLAQLHKDKCPFVWLVEPYREREYQDKLSNIARKSTLVVVFLDAADISEWTTNKHYEEVITPMEALKNAFFDSLYKSNLFLDLEYIDTIRQVMFGVESGKGHDKGILNENLSGIECRFDLDVRKQYCN